MVDEAQLVVWTWVSGGGGGSGGDSPQQNLPMGWPGLARLPNSISFRWESDGRASWYSGDDESRQTVRQTDGHRQTDRQTESERVTERLTTVHRLHLPLDSVLDHQRTDKELSPPGRHG